MNLPKERQGHLEDLNHMTVPQLKDLLARQEKILSKKNFLANLADKGEKSRSFAEKLKQIIAYRQGDVRITTKSNAEAFKSQQESKEDIFKSKDNTILKTLVTRNETTTTYSLETQESSDSPIEVERLSEEASNPEDITQQMQELSVGTEVSKELQNHANSYERVIKKAELDPSTIQVKFVPNRLRKDASSSPSTPSQIKPQTSRIKEESAVRPPVYNHQSTKLISIEESIQLIQEQKQRTKQLAAERAAERLADQLSTKMETYQPSRVDMSYRQSEKKDDDDEQDSDDFPSDDDAAADDDDKGQAGKDEL